MLAVSLAAGLALSAGGAALAAPIGKLKQFKVPTANSEPFAITNGPVSDGNRWFTEGTGASGPAPAKIARITPAGAITEFLADSTDDFTDGCSGCTIHDIDQGGGILYMTTNDATLLRFNVSTEQFLEPVATFVPPLSGSFNDLAVGGDNVWITDFNTNGGTIWRYHIATGDIDRFPAQTPLDIAVDAAGNAWFTENSTHADGTINIGRISKEAQPTDTDAVTYTPIPAPAGSITVAPNGKVWFGEAFDAFVGFFDPATPSDQTVRPVPATPAGIAAAPNGTIWFTQQQKGNIASITEAGVITEGKVVKDSGPFGITVAPNGDPWYTMQTANKIATLQLR